jgi:hypothetical protein
MAFTSTSLKLALAVLDVGYFGTFASSVPDVSPSLQDILNKANQGPLYTYPTSLAQGIIPVSNTLDQFLCQGVWYEYKCRKESILIMTVDFPPINHMIMQLTTRQIGVMSPFYTALSICAISAEADVWLYNGALYMGREQGALTTARTFESLYINIILDTLKHQNPSNSSFLQTLTHNGVFDTSGGQTLYLLVDLKIDGASPWPVAVKALDPL